MITLGVTGTDTGVGKTLVSCALITAFRRRGMSVAAMKPVETGGSNDAELLRAATGNRDPLDLVRPLQLTEPAAPLVAAQTDGVQISIPALNDAFRELKTGCDAIVVEGAGGLLVPITASENYASLFARWKLELIVVAPNRLGVINHTLLTLHAARTFGIPIRGVVLNDIAPENTLSHRTNAEVIATQGGTPVWQFPHTSADDLSSLEKLGEELLEKIL